MERGQIASLALSTVSGRATRKELGLEELVEKRKKCEPHVRVHDRHALDVTAVLALRLYLHRMSVRATSGQQRATCCVEHTEEPRGLWARGWWGIRGRMDSKGRKPHMWRQLAQC
jgi:hypothetical protein